MDRRWLRIYRRLAEASEEVQGAHRIVEPMMMRVTGYEPVLVLVYDFYERETVNISQMEVKQL
jgi:hypothetical protein